MKLQIACFCIAVCLAVCGFFSRTFKPKVVIPTSFIATGASESKTSVIEPGAVVPVSCPFCEPAKSNTPSKEFKEKENCLKNKSTRNVDTCDSECGNPVVLFSCLIDQKLAEKIQSIVTNTMPREIHFLECTVYNRAFITGMNQLQTIRFAKFLSTDTKRKDMDHFLNLLPEELESLFLIFSFTLNRDDNTYFSIELLKKFTKLKYLSISIKEFRKVDSLMNVILSLDVEDLVLSGFDVVDEFLKTLSFVPGPLKLKSLTLDPTMDIIPVYISHLFFLEKLPNLQQLFIISPNITNFKELLVAAQSYPNLAILSNDDDLFWKEDGEWIKDESTFSEESQ